MGPGQASTFSSHHRVLNRDRWSSRAAAERPLLHLPLDAFVPGGPVVIGIDGTIERRWGGKIRARGIYRDPARSSRGHFVRASGRRRISAMVLAPIPRAGRPAGRVRAVPFLPARAPSARLARERGRRHKRLPDRAPSARLARERGRRHKRLPARARQLLVLVTRWLPERRPIVVADGSYAATELLAAVSPPSPVAPP